MAQKSRKQGTLQKVVINGRKYELPAQVINRGQFSVSVSTPQRKAVLLKLLRKAGTNSVGTAAWKAILAYIGEIKEVKE